MRKTLPALILALALLCACGNAGNTAGPTSGPEQSPPAVTPATEPEPEPEGFQFTLEDFPRLDGSTSTAPLAKAMCMELLGVTEDKAAELVNFSRTTRSYYHLINDWADLLIVAECNDEVLAEKESRGFEWEKTPFATDAFVFVVNEDNPVSSITVDQARKIYAGEITNWSQLGGEDREIIPFQRNEGAGSQTLMEKLVMDGEPMMDAPTGYVIGSMGELMEAVRGYDGSPGAIGYSVYYYAEDMRMAKGLKILAVDGVDPMPETIRAGDYPLTNPYYVVIPAASAEGSATRELYNWLLSEPGQRLAAREGYVSIMDVEVEGHPAPEPEVGTRRYEQYTDHLIPSDDYGQLIPYAGARLADDFRVYTGCLYGLMTLEGEVVTDPVYSDVYSPRYSVHNKAQALPMLILVQSGASDPDSRSYAVAASDGSWCTDFDYDYVTYSAQGLVLGNSERIDVMLPDGTMERSINRAQLGMSAEQIEEMRERIDFAFGEEGKRLGDYIVLYHFKADEQTGELYCMCYDLRSGKRVEVPDSELDEIREKTREEMYGFSAADAHEYPDGVTPLYDSLLSEDEPLLLIREQNGDDIVLSYSKADGTPIPWLKYGGFPHNVSLVGGLIEVLDLNEAAYYELDTLKCVFRTRLNYEED